MPTALEYQAIILDFGAATIEAFTQTGLMVSVLNAVTMAINVSRADSPHALVNVFLATSSTTELLYTNFDIKDMHGECAQIEKTDYLLSDNCSLFTRVQERFWDALAAEQHQHASETLVGLSLIRALTVINRLNAAIAQAKLSVAETESRILILSSAEHSVAQKGLVNTGTFEARRFSTRIDVCFVSSGSDPDENLEQCSTLTDGNILHFEALSTAEDQTIELFTQLQCLSPSLSMRKTCSIGSTDNLTMHGLCDKCTKNIDIGLVCPNCFALYCEDCVTETYKCQKCVGGGFVGSQVEQSEQADTLRHNNVIAPLCKLEPEI